MLQSLAFQAHWLWFWPSQMVSFHRRIFHLSISLYMTESWYSSGIQAHGISSFNGGHRRRHFSYLHVLGVPFWDQMTLSFPISRSCISSPGFENHLPRPLSTFRTASPVDNMLIFWDTSALHNDSLVCFGFTSRIRLLIFHARCMDNLWPLYFPKWSPCSFANFSVRSFSRIHL